MKRRRWRVSIGEYEPVIDTRGIVSILTIGVTSTIVGLPVFRETVVPTPCF